MGSPICLPVRASQSGAVPSARFSPDGQRVVIAADNTARVWDATNAKAIGEPMKHRERVISAEFSSDGQRVATASDDGTARLWDAATGKAIGEPMKHLGPVIFAEFSSDGQRVVTASKDGTARLWDALTGKQTGELMEPGGAVTSAQFSPDGRRVVTASDDGTARLWDGLTGKQIGRPMEHGGWVVHSARFSPDGQRVVTASDDGTARLWDVPTLSSKDIAEDVLLLADLAEATSGVAIRTSGQVETRNAVTPEQVRGTLEKIAAKFPTASSHLTPLQRFLKWSVSGARTRTIYPFSESTVAEWVENRINEGTVDGLRAAIQVDPANARLAAEFGLSLADDALKKRTEPAKSRQERAEADFQTRRALKLAPDNDEVTELRAEVVTVLQLSSE